MASGMQLLGQRNHIIDMRHELESMYRILFEYFVVMSEGHR